MGASFGVCTPFYSLERGMVVNILHSDDEPFLTAFENYRP